MSTVTVRAVTDGGPYLRLHAYVAGRDVGEALVDPAARRITYVYVEEDHRRRGVGAALVNAARARVPGAALHNVVSPEGRAFAARVNALDRRRHAYAARYAAETRTPHDPAPGEPTTIPYPTPDRVAAACAACGRPPRADEVPGIVAAVLADYPTEITREGART